jgi:hypothetical protein
VTNEQLKHALLTGHPVVFTDSDGRETEYECVSAIVYRAKDGQVVVSAEIVDKCGRSLLYCDPKRLKVVSEIV